MIHHGGRMQIEYLMVGAFQSNCYLLFDEVSKDAVIIDPGDEPDRIIVLADRLKVNVTSILPVAFVLLRNVPPAKLLNLKKLATASI